MEGAGLGGCRQSGMLGVGLSPPQYSRSKATQTRLTLLRGGTTALPALPRMESSPELHKHPQISPYSSHTPSSGSSSSSGVNASHKTALTPGVRTRVRQHVYLTPPFSTAVAQGMLWMLGCQTVASPLLQLMWEVLLQPDCPGWPGVLQIIAVRPRRGQAAAGVRMGMNYGCASLLGEQRAPAAGHLLLQR